MTDYYENINENVRATFGITDPATSRRYTDLKEVAIQTRTFQRSMLDKKFLMYRRVLYSLIMQKDVPAALELLKGFAVVKVVISFQQRTDGNYAIVKLFDHRLEYNRRTITREAL